MSPSPSPQIQAHLQTQARPQPRPRVPGPPPEPWVPEAEVEEGEEEEVRQSGLPVPLRGADLAPSYLHPVWTLLCFTVTLAVYVALVPRIILYSSPPTGDQPFYLMDTISLVQDGDLELSNNYANRDEDKFYGLAPHPPDFVGMSAPYPLPPQLTESKARPENEWYGAHLPGLSVALVPAWVVGSWFQLWWPATVVFMCVVGALVATNVFLLAHEMTGRLWVAVAVWLPVAFSNPVMSYSFLLFTELPTGLLLIYAFRRLARGWGANGPVRLLLVGAATGYIPWLAWRCAPIAGALIAYGVVQWWRWYRPAAAGLRPWLWSGSGAGSGAGGQMSAPEIDSGGGPTARAVHMVRTALRAGLEGFRARLNWRSGVQLALFALPLLISGVLVVWYSLFLFGTLIPAGGGSLVRGQPALFHWPWGGGNEAQRYLMGLFGLLFDRQFGLLTYAPVYVLSVPGMIAMGRSARGADRRLLAWMAAVSVPYLLVLAAFEWWHGVWCPPARYMVTFVPLLAAPLAMSLFASAHSVLYRVIYGLLALPGWGFMAIMMYDPRMLWPANSVLNWLAESPDWPVPIDLRGILPYFEPPDDVRLPARSGWVLGLSVALSILGYVLMGRRAQGLGERRLPPGIRALVWVGVLGLVGSGWLGMNYDYLRHRTTLTLLARWNIVPPPAEPHGIAYLGDKIYIADFKGRSVIVLDLRTGRSDRLVPVGGQGEQESVQFVAPGDVQVGPDGLLYVLNNGGGDQELLVMKPDGGVVRKIALRGKTPNAFSLTFDAEGNIYVGDMQGGRAFKYGPDGGDPLVAFSGMTGGLNNTGGVAVAEDGTVYASEYSSRRVHHMNRDGSFIRKFDLPCQPWYMAREGEWVDITCGSGVVSINTRTEQSQLALIDNDVVKLDSPAGLTYAPDGTLYMVDGGTIYAFRVRH